MLAAVAEFKTLIDEEARSGGCRSQDRKSCFKGVLLSHRRGRVR